MISDEEQTGFREGGIEDADSRSGLFRSYGLAEGEGHSDMG
jgi:hypothetical protein